jgi:AraC-like DNA-binding protein
VHFKDTSYVLNKEIVILIPPNTAFSTKLKNNPSGSVKESILGKQIENISELDYVENDEKADHLFVHFNLGLEPDHVIPGLYVFRIDETIKILIDQIKQQIISNGLQINLSQSLFIHALIFHFLKEMPSNAWNNKVFDIRVLKSINFLEKHIDRKISNRELASMANMATNSFARLFHENINYSLQEYIRKNRIEKACKFMHHTSDSIDMIAINCGFGDRQHFSKVFKQIMNISPAVYKKRHTLDPGS